MAKKQPDDPLARARAASERARKELEAEKVVRPPTFQEWCATVSPRWTWDWPHQLYLYPYLERVAAGECKRLMVFMPPRHGKSETCTTHFSSFWLERNPDKKVILAAHTQKLANKFSRTARRIVSERLPLSDERKAAAEWETLSGGAFVATGIGGGLPGFGGDLIIIDDPIREPEEAESEGHRDKVWEWYTGVLSNRQEPDAAIFLIQTRWHWDDLAGRLLAAQETGGDTWEVVVLPALAEDDDPLGRRKGEALCPARYKRDWLLKEQSKDAYRFAALYQQQPTPKTGGVFQREWFAVVPVAPDGLRWVRYWDLAQSIKKTGKYTASAAVAFGPDGTLYIRDMIHYKKEWPDSRRIIKACMQVEPDVVHGIEEKLHGLTAIQEFRRMPDIAHIAFLGVPVDGDKMVRAMAWSPRAREGKVKFVYGTKTIENINERLLKDKENDGMVMDVNRAWIEAAITEIVQFPRGLFNDQVDTISGGCVMVATGWALNVEHGGSLDSLFYRR